MSHASPVIDISPCAGFCGGVRRTLNLVEKLLLNHSGTPIYMLGKIVHNDHVLKQLRRKGLKIINDFRKARGGILIIQSHGISRSLFNAIKESGIQFIDSTCPMVKNIHDAARELEEEGRQVIIIGKNDHDEVKGIAGQVESAIIFGKPCEVNSDKLKGIKKVGVVVQSTFIQEDARKILENIRKFIDDVKYIETICKPTLDRQSDAGRNASKYDCVFVLGSKDSANTINLFNIVRKRNTRVYLVSDSKEVDNADFSGCRRTYVISGASTPQDLIELVVKRIKQKFGAFTRRAS